MLTRTITGILLALYLVSLIWIRGLYFKISIVIIMGLALAEIFDAFKKKGFKPARWLCVVYPLAIFVLNNYIDVGSITLMMIFVALSSVILSGKANLENMMANIFPLVYPGYMFSLLMPMLNEPDIMRQILFLTVGFIVALAGDTFAMFFGIRLGKRKLCPEISPKKTVEGAIGGLFGSIIITIITGIIFNSYGANISIWIFALIGAVGGIASQFGDLIASVVKRYCGIKDYGVIFPGHGGVMDRLDGICCSIMVAYIAMLVIK